MERARIKRFIGKYFVWIGSNWYDQSTPLIPS
jgi:hypothetical protein